MKRARLLLLPALIVIGCPKQQSTSTAEAGPTPLERALILAGGEIADLTLPVAEEAGYSIATRYPVIDAVLARPAAAGPWAERLAKRLDGTDDVATLTGALAPLTPGGGPVESPSSESRESTAVGDDPQEGYRRSDLPSPVEALTSARGALRIEHLDPVVRDALVDLARRLEALHAASSRWHPGGAGPVLPPRPPEDYFIDPRTGLYRYGTHPVGVQRSFLEDGIALDHAAMWAAAAELTAATKAWATTLRDDLERIRKEEARARRPGSSSLPPPTNTGPLLHMETSLGAIVVGGRGPDQHLGDALLAIDLAGDDTWSNNAGANFGIPGVAAVALDVDGNDRYRSERPHTQGAGFGGIGVLVDAGSGSDGYFAGVQAQGAGFFGVGVLWDDGGDDAYQATGFAQGAGTFGAGLLVDGGGNDEAIVRGRGQGFGATLGLGAFVDLAGDDQRRLGLTGRDRNDPSSGIGQGAGWGTRPFPWRGDVALHGGVGLLYDRAGNDVYFGRAQSQGSGWFLGLGLLLERAGDDRYLGEERSQGSGTHLAAGILVDGDGADAYTGVRGVQGSGDDRALGLLWDRGDSADGYSLGPGSGRQGQGREGQGFARRARALGILVDDGGDDAYTADRDALGEAIVPARPVPPPHGLFLDLGGTDTYEKAARRPNANPTDGAYWSSEDLAAGVDTTADAPGFLDTGIPDDFGPAGLRTLPPAAIAEFTGPTAEYAALDAAIRIWLDGGPEPPPPAEPPRDLRVLRLAAKLRVLLGDPGGVDALIATFVRRSEDQDGRDGAALPTWVSVATGLSFGWEPGEARGLWRDRGAEVDLDARLPAVLDLERARFAAEDQDAALMLGFLRSAVESAPSGDRTIRARAAALAGAWARIHAHEEAGERHRPALARRLAESAILWDPRDVGAFVNFAWATLHEGDLEACRRALRKIAVADPDHPELTVLQNALEDTASSPDPRVP